MSDKYQYLLGALVPSVLVILSWIHNNTRLSRLEVGLDSTNRRMEAIQEATNRRMEAIQEATHRRVEVLQETTNRRFDDLNGRMDDLVRGFHADMMSFQASLLEAVYQLRERVTAVETKQDK